MAITHVRSGTGTGNSTSAQVTLGAAPTQNNLLVAIVSARGTLTAAGTWNKLTEIEAIDFGSLFWKVAGAGESATQSPCTHTSGEWACVISEYAGTDVTSPLEANTANLANLATKTTTGTADPADGVERLIVVGGVTDGNRTFSAQKVNGSTTGVTERGDVGTGTTNGGCAVTLADLIQTTTVAGNYTAETVASTGDNGSAHIAIFKPLIGGAVAARATAHLVTPAGTPGHTTPLTPVRAGARMQARGGPPRAGTADFTGISGQSLTPGLPADWAPDDIHILLFGHKANAQMAALAGWTQIQAQNNGAALRAEVWWRRAQAGDTAPTVSLVDNNVTTVRAARIFGVRGCPPTLDPFDGGSISSNPSSATVSFTDLTTTVENDFILALVLYADDPTDITTMAGFTERADAVASWDANPAMDDSRASMDDDSIPMDGGSGAAMIAYEWRTVTTPGATGASSLTVSGGSFTNSVNIGILLALRTIETVAPPATSGVAGLRGGARVATAGVRAASTTTAVRSGARTAAVGVRAATASVASQAATRVATATRHGGLATTAPRLGSRLATAVVRGGLATVSLRARAQATTLLEAPASTAAVALRTRVQASLVAGRAVAATATAEARARAAVTGRHGALAVAETTGAARQAATGARAGRAATFVGSTGILAALIETASEATTTLQTAAAVATTGVRGALGTLTTAAGSRLATLGVRGATGQVQARATTQLRAAGFETEASVALGTAARLATSSVRASLATAEARTASGLATAGVRGGLAAVGLATTTRAVALAGAAERLGVALAQAATRLGSVGLRLSRAVTALRGRTVLTPGTAQVGHLGLVRVVGRAQASVAGVRKLSPRIPMEQLTPIDLGTGYRGDTMVLPVWSAIDRQGDPVDLTNGTIWFTAKVDLVLSDADPHVIQTSTADGGVVLVGPPEEGRYRVTIAPQETQTLVDDTVFTWDVQLNAGDLGNIYTIKRGLLTVVRDVTRTPA